MSTIVDTKNGKVQGIQDGPVAVWRGIRYAKAPIGELRFRAPQPPEPWGGVYHAAQFGPVAHQVPRVRYETEGLDFSEDCLRLNIWSPGADGTKRPVMVFIHGGTFRSGSGQQRLYDGHSFAEQGDVVLVTINYRLGALGFLYLGGIGGDDYASSGNLGLLDQIAALKWVQDNIEAFGGDANRVTVFGESAGAMSISALLCMPDASGLFHQAILQSGVLLGAMEMLDVASAEQQTRHIMTSIGLSDLDLDALLQMPAQELVERTRTMDVWRPMVDGVTLPRSLTETLKRGDQPRIPMVMGSNLREWAYFFLADPEWPTLSDETRKQRILAGGVPLTPELEAFYLTGKSGESFSEALSQLVTFAVFAGPVQVFADALATATDVWVYRMDWGTGPWKACHGAELELVFNTANHPSASVGVRHDDHRSIVNQMHRTWIAFAHNQNPNNETIPYWPQYNRDRRPTMVFDSESCVVADPYGDERRAWQSVRQR